MAPPLPPARSTLFHAIVVTGVALTGCGGEATSPTTPTSGTSDAAPPPSDAGVDAAPAKTDGGCPAGSELPVPPCYLIR